MLTVVAAAAMGRSCSAGIKADIKSSSRGIFDNRSRLPHGNIFMVIRENVMF